VKSPSLVGLGTSRGPHSIIGPIAVNKAEPGDVLEIPFLGTLPALGRNFRSRAFLTGCFRSRRKLRGHFSQEFALCCEPVLLRVTIHTSAGIPELVCPLTNTTM
jgi:acetamidase/formamidase